MIRIQTEPFDVAELAGQLQTRASGRAGALVHFLGMVRDYSPDAGSRSLFLEHYPGMCEREIQALCDHATQRWDILDTLVVHRVGELPLGDPIVFVGVAAASPYKNVGDLLADAKARPGALNYGSWSVGNPVHLGSALLEAMSGTQMQHVVYKETSMLYTGVANGELNFSLGSLATAGPLQRAGKIRFIAVAAPKRHAAFPELPTVAESGGPAGYEVSGWTLLAAPKHLPKPLQDKIQADIQAVLAEPDVKERYAGFGYELFPTTRDQFAVYIASESTKYADVIRRAKVSLD